MTRAAISLAASVPAAGLALACFWFAFECGAWMRACLAAGIAAAAGTAALAAALAKKDAPPLYGARLAALPALACLVLAAAAAGAAALPVDLHLRTLSRPPAAIWFLAGGLAVITVALGLGVRRPAARSGLFLLVPLLALEGLPVGAPPALGLGVAAVLLLLAAAEPRPAPRHMPRAVALLGAAIVAFLAVLAAATWLGADPSAGVTVLVRLLALAAAFALIVRDAEPREAVRVAVLALLATLLAVAIFGLCVHAWSARAVAGLGVDVRGTELALFGRHPNAVAPWFGAGAVVALCLSLRPLRGIAGAAAVRWLARAALVPAAACTFLTASRLAVSCMFAAALLPAVVVAARRITGRRVAPAARSARALPVALAVVVAVSLAVAFVPVFRAKVASLAEVAAPGLGERLAENHRVHRMALALAAAREAPLLGHGPGNWFRQGAFAAPSRFTGESTADHPHDLFLAVLVSAGALGLAAFAALLVAAAFVARAALCAADPLLRAVAAAIALGLLAQLGTNLLDQGDALDTSIPSRLLVDLGILAAIAVAGASPSRASSRAVVVRSVQALAAVCGAAAALWLLAAEVDRARAHRRLREGDPRAAAASLERAAAMLPFDVPVRLELADLATVLRDASMARAAASAAEELAPDNPAVQEAKARMLSAFGNDQPASRALERAIALDPQGSTVNRLAPLAVDLALAAGDEAEAVATLARLTLDDPSAAVSRLDPARPGHIAFDHGAIPLDRLLDAMERADVGDQARARRRAPLRATELLLAAGFAERALQQVERLRAIEGTETPIYHHVKAQVLAALGRLDEALASNTAAQVVPNPLMVRRARGDMLLAAGRVDEAIAAYRDLPSVDLNFEADHYWATLGRLAAALEQAGRDAERADVLELRTFFTASHLERAMLLADAGEARLGRDGPAAAQPDLERSLAVVLSIPAIPDGVALCERLGRLLARARPADVDRTRHADRLDRFAWRHGGGAPVRAFLTAAYAELDLRERE